jgi:hypothetical protein
MEVDTVEVDTMVVGTGRLVQSGVSPHIRLFPPCGTAARSRASSFWRDNQGALDYAGDAEVEKYRERNAAEVINGQPIPATLHRKVRVDDRSRAHHGHFNTGLERSQSHPI